MVGDIVCIQDYRVSRKSHAPEDIELSLNHRNPTSILHKLDLDSLEPSLKDLLLDRTSQQKCATFQKILVDYHRGIENRIIRGRIIYAGSPIRELGKKG